VLFLGFFQEDLGRFPYDIYGGKDSWMPYLLLSNQPEISHSLYGPSAKKRPIHVSFAKKIAKIIAKMRPALIKGPIPYGNKRHIQISRPIEIRLPTNLCHPLQGS
jgi:hypothetical protein